MRLAPLKGARSRRRVGSTVAQRKSLSVSRAPHRDAQGARLTLSISQYALPTPGCGPYGGSCPGQPSRCAAKAAWRLRALTIAATRVAGRILRGASLQATSNHTNNESSAHYLQCRAASPEQPNRDDALAPISHLFHFSLTKILANCDKSLILPMLTALRRPGPRVICGWGSENLHMKSVYLALSS